MKQKTITLKKTPPTPLEAYAVKICPPDVQSELCVFGLPMFVRARVDAVNEACIMCNHLNINPDVVRLRFLGRYDNGSGVFIPPNYGERYEQNLAEALSAVNKESIHEAKQG